MEENHLDNILRILNEQDFEEDLVRWLNMYVATRGLLEVWWYSELTLDQKELLRKEIDEYLASLPLLGHEEDSAH